MRKQKSQLQNLDKSAAQRMKSSKRNLSGGEAFGVRKLASRV